MAGLRLSSIHPVCRDKGGASLRHGSETWLAWFTLFATSTHFVLETWYHLVWGQPLQALLVDYISVALMTLAGITSLRARPGSAAGLLAAAWSFNLGFGWRSAFGRLEDLHDGAQPANGEASFVLPIVAAALMVVGVVTVWSLWLAYRQTGSRSQFAASPRQSDMDAR